MDNGGSLLTVSRNVATLERVSRLKPIEFGRKYPEHFQRGLESL